MSINTSNSRFQLLFGENLNKLRNEQNLSFRQLAQRCDIDHSDISKIEKGERNIQLSSVLQLAKGLDVEPSELFNFKIRSDKENNSNLTHRIKFNHLRIANIHEFLSSYDNNISKYQSPFKILAELENRIKYVDNPDNIILCPYSSDGDIMFELVNIKEKGKLRIVEYSYTTTVTG